MKKRKSRSTVSQPSRKTRKVPTKATTKAQSQKAAPRRIGPYIFGAVILILILCGVAVWYFTPHNADVVAATVNGVPLTEKQLAFQYSLLPASYKDTFNKKDVLEKIIDEELVVQAAMRQGMNATPQDVNERVQEILAQNQLTPSDLQKNLESLNITLDQFESLVGRQITIERYLNATLKPATVDNATLLAMYNATKSQFLVGEQVTVRHVLISAQRADSAIIAKHVYDAAKNGTNFCKLVVNYSDDGGSRATCGQYTFPRGFMVPEFEKAAFDLKNGQIALVQTQFGFHIILKMNSSSATVKPFDQVQDTLRAQYLSSDRDRQYRDLVLGLRASATIIYANGTTIMPVQQDAVIAPAPQKDPVPVVDDAKDNDNDDAAPTAAAPVQTTAAAQTTATVHVAPPATAQAAPPDVPADQSLHAMFVCIASKSTLYGASWDSESQSARAMFAAQNADITYVECDTQTSACAGITAYPTWRILGKTYVGAMTPERLSVASGCK